MVDWGAGSYETTTGAELLPVAEVVIEAAGLTGGETVIDVATGTGNAALAAARRGAHVIGIDGAPRLLGIAAQRAAAEGLTLDLREGDLASLTADAAAADVVTSVFGVIFAGDPAPALRELHRVVRPAGQVLITAWVPDGPILAMLGAVGRIVTRITGQAPPDRFAWHDPAVLAPLAAAAGLQLTDTTAHRLPIRGESPEAYVTASEVHPMWLARAAAISGAGAEGEVREAQLAVLREANEDPSAFLVHSPYVVHTLTPAG